MDQKRFNKPLAFDSVQITDDFWKRNMELVRREVIPYQWETLNDRVPDAAPSFCVTGVQRAQPMCRQPISGAVLRRCLKILNTRKRENSMAFCFRTAIFPNG